MDDHSQRGVGNTQAIAQVQSVDFATVSHADHDHYQLPAPDLVNDPIMPILIR